MIFSEPVSGCALFWEVAASVVRARRARADELSRRRGDRLDAPDQEQSCDRGTGDSRKGWCARGFGGTVQHVQHAFRHPPGRVAGSGCFGSSVCDRQRAPVAATDDSACRRETSRDNISRQHLVTFARAVCWSTTTHVRWWSAPSPRRPAVRETTARGQSSPASLPPPPRGARRRRRRAAPRRRSAASTSPSRRTRRCGASPRRLGA